MRSQLANKKQEIWNKLETPTTLKELKELCNIDKLSKNDIILTLTNYFTENDVDKEELKTRIENIKTSRLGKKRMNPKIGKNLTLTIGKSILDDLGIDKINQRYKVSKDGNKIILTQTKIEEYKPS